jgi:hypothetical protein
MADEIKLSGAFSLQMVPVLESGANWSDFERRIQEWLVMSGLGSTLDRKNKPIAPEAEDNAAFIAQQAAFEQCLIPWEEKQSRGCMAIRNRCGYNQFVKVQGKTTVYEMMDTLRAGKSSGAGKLIDLTSRFYAVNLSDCKDVTDLSNTLAQINNELKDLHYTAAFTTVQLVLRFLQALGSAYEIFVTTFQQTHNLIESDGNPATSFDVVTQKAFDEEQRQHSSISGAGTALFAQGTSNPNVRMMETEWCTHCQKPGHTEPKCFATHPYLLKEHRAKKSAKRKAKTSGSSDAKKAKKDAKGSGDSERPGDGIAALMCLAIDSGSAGEITQSLMDSALSTQPIENEWVVDTGCTNHATSSLNHFTNIVWGDFGTCGGIGGPVKFEGKGTVEIPIPSKGSHARLTLTDVKYCPSMGPFNLISVSQLFKKTTPVLSENSISWMIGGYKVNATAKHGLWLLDTVK